MKKILWMSILVFSACSALVMAQEETKTDGPRGPRGPRPEFFTEKGIDLSKLPESFPTRGRKNSSRRIKMETVSSLGKREKPSRLAVPVVVVRTPIVVPVTVDRTPIVDPVTADRTPTVDPVTADRTPTVDPVMADRMPIVVPVMADRMPTEVRCGEDRSSLRRRESTWESSKRRIKMGTVLSLGKKGRTFSPEGRQTLPVRVPR